EDGIRDRNVTGVQTCALPILISDIAFAFLRPCGMRRLPPSAAGWRACRMFLRSALIIIKMSYADFQSFLAVGRENVKIVKISVKIGRASCRERVEESWGGRCM